MLLSFEVPECCGTFEVGPADVVSREVSRRSLRCGGCGVVRRFTVTVKVDRTATTEAEVIPLREVHR